MQDGTYPPMNFATFGPSELQPPFTLAYLVNYNLLSLTIKHWAGVRLFTSLLNLAKSCVFDKQSPLSIL